MSSATEPRCSESRQLGELFHHHALVLNHSSNVGVLPQQQSPKAYKTSLQKHPVRFSYAKSTTVQRGNSCAGCAKGAGMNSAATGLQHAQQRAELAPGFSNESSSRISLGLPLALQRSAPLLALPQFLLQSAVVQAVK